METFDNLAVGGLDAAAAAEAMIFMSNLCKPEYAPAKEGASGDESGHSLTKKRRRTGAKTGSAAARNKKTKSAGTTQAEPQPGVIVLHDPAQMLLAQMNAQIMSLRPLSVGGMQVSGLETAHSNAIAAPAKPYKAIPGSIFEWTSSHLGAYLTEAKQSGYSSDETSSDGNSSSSGSSSSGSSGSSSSPDGYASRSPGSSSALPDVLAQSHRNPKSHIRFVTSEPEPYSLNALAAWPTDADGNLDDNEGLEEIEMMGTTTGYECLEMKPVVRYTFPESQTNSRSWYIDDDGDVKRCGLRLDQHNPFLGTCIGFWNYKYFFLLEFYKLIGTGTALAAFLYRAVHEIQAAGGAKGAADGISPSIHGLVAGVLILVSLLTAVYFIYILIWFRLRLRIMGRNYTRLEYFEKAKAAETKVASDGRKVRDIWKRSLFDQGSWCLNMMEYLGTCPLLWLLPIHS
eukprot:g155.t1